MDSVRSEHLQQQLGQPGDWHGEGLCGAASMHGARLKQDAPGVVPDAEHRLPVAARAGINAAAPRQLVSAALETEAHEGFRVRTKPVLKLFARNLQRATAN